MGTLTAGCFGSCRRRGPAPTCPGLTAAVGTFATVHVGRGGSPLLAPSVDRHTGVLGIKLNLPCNINKEKGYRSILKLKLSFVMVFLNI